MLKATRFLEADGEKATLSRYLPAVHQVRAAHDSRKSSHFSVPEELREKCGQKIPKARLCDTARRLAAFYHDDVQKVQEKHLAVAGSEKLCAMATFLDI
eukprot:9473318-Pyramimonas_sp.AAC.2